MGYSPRGHKELAVTEQLSTHTALLLKPWGFLREEEPSQCPLPPFLWGSCLLTDDPEFLAVSWV